MSERMIINSVYGIGIEIKKHCLRLYVVKNISLKIALCGLRWFKLNVSKCQKDRAIVYRGYGVQGV